MNDSERYTALKYYILGAIETLESAIDQFKGHDTLSQRLDVYKGLQTYMEELEK